MFGRLVFLARRAIITGRVIRLAIQDLCGLPFLFDLYSMESKQAVFHGQSVRRIDGQGQL